MIGFVPQWRPEANKNNTNYNNQNNNTRAQEQQDNQFCLNEEDVFNCSVSSTLKRALEIWKLIERYFQNIYWMPTYCICGTWN